MYITVLDLGGSVSNYKVYHFPFPLDSRVSYDLVWYFSGNLKKIIDELFIRNRGEVRMGEALILKGRTLHFIYKLTFI